MKSMKDTFDRIYEKKLWGTQGGGSGKGSDVNFTVNMRQGLSNFVRLKSIRSIRDVSCGSMVWMSEFLKDNPTLNFYGTDISKLAIDQAITNSKELINRVELSVSNFLETSYDEECDLLICRDTMQHFSFDSNLKAMDFFASSKFKWIALSSYLQGSNKKIEDGGCFAINLLKAPFNLVPDYVISEMHVEDIDHPCDQPKSLFIFNRKNFLKQI